MKILFKESIVSIKKNFKRYISILLIVLLGVGFFAGIRVTSPNMKKTLDAYYKSTNFMNLNLLSTWGIKDEDIEEFEKSGYIVEPSYEFDAVVKGTTEEVIKIISYNPNSKINKLILLDGRLPEEKDECVIEYNQYTESHKVGDKILVEDSTLKEKKLTIVGIIKSPIYTSLERGNTKLLSGKINFFMYVPISNFNKDYYTNLYVDLNTNLSVFSDEYKELIDKNTNKIENITKTLADKKYNDEVEKAKKELDNKQKQLNDEKSKYNFEIKSAENKINNALSEYRTNLKNLNNQAKNTEEKFENLYKELEEKTKELEYGQQTLNESKKKFEYTKKELLNTISEIEKNIKELENQLTLKTEALNKLNIEKENLINLINDNIDVDTNNTKLTEVNEKISASKLEIEILNKKINELKLNIDTINTNIIETEKKLSDEQKNIDSSFKILKENKEIINKSKNEANEKINSSRIKLNNAYQTIMKNKEELESKKIEAKKKFEDADIQIKNAQKEINSLEKPTWYILDHNSNLGFYQYSQDVDRINNLGKVFPFVFFVVAILICLTSITRMVEEERNQLGTLKALGYSSFQIMTKYINYALSATVVGSILGVLIGFSILPKVIFMMYGMMYNIGDILLDFNIYYALYGTILAIICTLFATVFACYKELKESPASLMRPKAPKAGKRVLLERIHFIWKRLSFNRKVTFRNVFRHKKRFLMTVIGISGCTGLIISGFGLKDCVTGMVPNQYDKVFNYDIEVTFKDNVTIDEKDEEINRILSNDKINDLIRVEKTSIKLDNKNTNQTIQLIVPFDDLDEFINLSDRKTGKKYKLSSNNKIIVTEKLAKLLDLKSNDKLVINNDDKIYNVKIDKFTENYLHHYIYMDKSTYDSDYFNTLLIKTGDLTEKEENELSNFLRKNNKIADITFTNSMRGIFDSTMKNFGYVTIVLIVSAGLLAFVVLYNLANVNISERKRELATIKVLGFYDKEVYDYIGRETTILTIIGMALGILIGKILTMYIITTCELDFFMFNTKISINSYIYSLLITLIFTFIVNITTYFALKKVDMIESLKSVE